MQTVCCLGLGRVGLPFSLSLAKYGYKVIGIDIDEEKVKKINEFIPPYQESGIKEYLEMYVKSGMFKATTNESHILNADVIIILVPTSTPEGKKPTLEIVKKVAKTIGKHLMRDQLVIMRSTVLPGTTEQIIRPILERESNLKEGKDFYLAYSHERLASGKVFEDIERIPKVVAGASEASLKKALAFFSSLPCKIVTVSDCKTAEFTKLAETTFSDLIYAYGNELARLADRFGIDYEEVIKAANTHYRVSGPWVGLKKPGIVGGHCVPVNTKYLLPSKLLQTVRETNEQIISTTFKLIKKNLISLRNKKIGILGLTYKANCDSIQGSKVIDLINILKEAGADIFIRDNFVENAVIKKYGKTLNNLNEIDCLILMVGHNQFKELDLSNLNNKTILIDTCLFYDPNKLTNIKYLGIGRSIRT